MSKKFITVENGKVQLTHFMPFDSKEGFGKTEAELLQMGYLLDEIPEPEKIKGKIPVACYTEEKGFYYEYEDEPKQNMTLAQSVQSGIITPEQFKAITGMDYQG